MTAAQAKEKGGTSVLPEVRPRRMLQLGAGLPLAYGRVTVPLLYRLLAVHTYYRAINNRGFAIEQRGASNLLASVLGDLEGPGAPVEETAGSEARNAASLYVGHDTNLDGLAVLLNLSWAPLQGAPYPRDATPPGSMLRLTRSGDGADAVVSADFLYTSFEVPLGPDQLGQMWGTPAKFSGGREQMPLSKFAAAARGVLDWRCVRNATGEASS